MRYLISKQQIPSPNYETCTAEESLAYLNNLDEIAVDTETLGFDPYTCALISLQIGDGTNQYFIDTATIDIQNYKKLLESKLLVMQHGKFDLRFLYHHRIVPTRIFDTYLAERTLYLGIDSHRAGLDSLCKEYLGIELSKEERKNISARLTESLIVYGCKDVEYLLEIKRTQERLIKEKGLEVSIELDNRFVKVLAYIEYCGLKLDVNKWQERLDKNKAEVDKITEELTNYLIENGYNEFLDQQGDLFAGKHKPKSKINWNSSSQVIKLFGKIGIPTEVIDKGEVKHTTEGSHLIKFKDQFPIIETYIKFKEYMKDIGTYGENWFKMINPVSGRIHTSYKQLMNTGRLSSGGKNKATGESYPNFQNIPSDEETRSCFVAEEGNVLIGCDYTGQEQVVLVNKCLDKNLLEFYDNDLGDMHSFVASKMYPELENVSLKDIKKNHSKERQSAKIAGFAINYGGSGIGIAEQLGISKEQGEHIYNSYFNAFPGLKDYFDAVKKFGLDNGYVLISPVTGKKSYIDGFEDFKEKSNETDKEWWNTYKKHKEAMTPTYSKMKKQWQYISMKKGEIERMSLNYPIQGESAEITKLSAIYFWEEYLVPNNLLFIVKFVNVIHDENLIEAPEELAQEACKELVRCMEKSGEKFCKRVPLKAEPSIATYWKK